MTVRNFILVGMIDFKLCKGIWKPHEEHGPVGSPILTAGQ